MTTIPQSNQARSAPTRPVAFLDESYDWHPDGTREPVYVLAAVIIDGDQVDAARQRARAVVAPETEYHTTDLAHDGRTAEIVKMLEHVRDDAGWSVVAVHSPFSGHADLARQVCLRQLLPDLSGRKVGRVVADSRYQPNARDPKVMDRQDQATARALRQENAIHRHLSLRHETDAAEPLLWLPDGAAWSVRRAMVADDNAYYDIIKPVTSLLVVESS